MMTHHCKYHGGDFTVRSVICPVFLLTLSWVISTSSCFHVHLSSPDPGGTVVINATLSGQGLEYRVKKEQQKLPLSPSFNFTSPGVLQFRIHDSLTGCRTSKGKPHLFNVIATQRNEHFKIRHNSSLIPYHVFVGELCKQSMRKWKSQTMSSDHIVTLHLPHSQICFQKNHKLLSLYDYIPLHFHACKIKAFLPSLKFSVNQKTLDISLSSHPCLPNEVSFRTWLKITCKHSPTQYVPYLIILKSHSNRDHKRIWRRRLKRQAGNNAPSFDESQYTEHIAEEQIPGVLVYTMQAKDNDVGEAGLLTYSMEANMDLLSQDMFDINAETGAVKTTVSLDREEMTEHSFLITVRDNALPESEQRSATTYLKIIVDDINDHVPTFPQPSDRLEIKENGLENSEVYSVRATDKDSGDNSKIRYSIINSGPPNDDFMIEPQTGSISTRHSLDREQVAAYSLLIQAMDQGELNSRKSSTFTLTINVEDENDNKPKFLKNDYKIQLREDHPVSTVKEILNVTATDADAGPNSHISYRLTNLASSDNTFSIDSFSGKLYLVKSLDFERKEQFQLSVWAEDQGKTTRRTMANVLVEVLDVNDNKPKFIEESYVRSIAENVGADASVLQVEAEDSDSRLNSLLTYSIKTTDVNFPFKIDPQTGWITTIRDLDREDQDRYTFIVKAQDGGEQPLSSNVSVTLVLQDINDNPPVFQQRRYNASISEEASKGDLVIIVKAIDKDEGDNARIRYSISSGNDKAAFQIRVSNGEGVITVNKKLDAREQNKYVLSILAEDRDGLSDTVPVHIDVTDTNRHPPVFQGQDQFSFSVSEDTEVDTSVFTILALDEDRGENQRITYSLTPSTTFSIDPDTGVIKTRQKLDRDTNPLHILSVTATDNGKPPQAVTAEVVVTVTDVNDNKPEFKEHKYFGEISEDDLVGKDIIQVSATDIDEGVNGQVRYTFEGGEDGGGSFSIDNQGWVRLAKQVDREEKASYDLVAVAVDSHPTDPQSASVIIHVTIKDVNDNSPIFEKEEVDVMINENSPIGSTVAVITANDPDEGANALVKYSFASGADSDKFQLSGRRGDPAIITTLVSLDYEKGKKQYEVTLRAASDTKISTAKVKINVQDVNDNVPILQDFSIIYNNFRGNFTSGPIGKIPAHDPDVSDQDKLVYKILSGNNATLLHLNSTTGEVTLDPRLNSDVPRHGTFVISVSDGVTEVKAQCQLWVRLVTEAMLHSAVTIRLDRMTQTAFLSPLLDFFVDGLAALLDADRDDIFVINVEEDVDVPEQILNVSVSVRRDSVIVQGQSTDVFYRPEYLREVIYLHRATLAERSTLQVLPFDDNLCLVEPCTNYEACRSVVVAGIPRPFISSTSVLFRPVHPNMIFVCVCPTGFAGQNKSKMCDTEIDLCYSHPCQNNGQCIRHESGYSCHCKPGFTGHLCELNQTATFTSLTCPADQCHGPSHCVPLSGGGFFCEGCPQDSNHDARCRLTTKSFQKGSYLTFPSLKARIRFTIQFWFATQEKNGLLLYNGRFNGEHDYVALEIVSGQLRFSFNIGSNVTTTLTSNVEHGVSTGHWTMVKLEYVNRVVTMTVGEDCDTEISIQYASKLGLYSCASRVEHVIHPSCESFMADCHRHLDLTGPLQVGGMPVEHRGAHQLTHTSFVGCLANLELNHQPVDLDSAIADHLTTAGCPPKKKRCQASPCQMGGKCTEGWNTFICDCPERSGGKDCSQTIERSRQLKGNGYLLYSSTSQPVVRYPWFNGIAFRTRTADGTLMQVLFNSLDVVIKIVNGLIYYQYDKSNTLFHEVRVDDGKWHYFEVRWHGQGSVDMFLDYEQYSKRFNMSSSIIGKVIEMVYVGAYRNGNRPMADHFSGCVKDIRVGNTDRSFMRDPKETKVEASCVGSKVCEDDTCGPGTCVDEWNKHTCDCPPGTIGPHCQEICTHFMPCKNWAECRQPVAEESTYTCECGVRQSGKYCETQAPPTCPTRWWGKPTCGPCNCDPSKGFEEICNKDNGTCSCKALHYLPPGDDTCHPCDCYRMGSTDLSCDPCTGQCKCQEGVVGRRCDQCDSKFAAVAWVERSVEGQEEKEQIVTCHVSYDECPRNHAQDIWWEEIAFGLEAVQDCPKGATGNAKRQCTEEDSWLQADLFGCTSDSFLEHEAQLREFEAGVISPFIANYTLELLKNVSYTVSPIYGGDVMMTYRLTKVILEYEISQKGLDMISQQYRNFVQKLLVVLSNMTHAEYVHYWQQVGEMTGGAGHLLNLFERFVRKTVTLLPQAQSGNFEAVSDDIVLGADWVSLYNFSGVTVPKYDNNVKSGTIDKLVSVTLSANIFSSLSTGSEFGVDTNKAYIGYAVYRDFGLHVPVNTDASVSRTSSAMMVNSPLLTVVLAERGQVKEGSTATPISIKFRLVRPNNRTNLQCARWVPSADQKTGTWTARGCMLQDTSCHVRVGSDHCEEYFVTCVCSHLSTFTIIIDVSEGGAPILNMEVVTYILTALSLLLLLLSFFVLFTFKRLQCNWNSIHINLIFVIFIFQLAFVIGINETSPELLCRLVAIILHYFYIAVFAWLFVEFLHMYRMLTEKATINYGAMKFYYLLGYVIPGIIVGLAVGLYTDAYGNDSFCWLSTSEAFVWSLAGPIAVIVVMNVITFMLGAHASFAEKIQVTDVKAIRLGLLIAILLLFLLCATWVVGLLAVNERDEVLQYLYAIFTFLDGLYIFLVYILLNKKVRWCIKRFYYRMKGKKLEFDEQMGGNRASVHSRSALAYRRDSSGEGRINVGISTVSTTSRSTKSSMGDKYLQSTSSSNSGAPIGLTSIPYGFESPFKENIKEEPDGVGKNDSDSDSDGSIDRNSLELASSHSSDEDDDFDINPAWETQVPKTKAVEHAIEQIEKMKRDKERDRLGNHDIEDLPTADQGEESPSGRMLELQPSALGTNPPDVTLSTLLNHPALPQRSDSLPVYNQQGVNSPGQTRQPSNTVQVLTHNGSISSDSESSETTV